MVTGIVILSVRFAERVSLVIGVPVVVPCWTYIGVCILFISILLVVGIIVLALVVRVPDVCFIDFYVLQVVANVYVVTPSQSITGSTAGVRPPSRASSIMDTAEDRAQPMPPQVYTSRMQETPVPTAPSAT